MIYKLKIKNEDFGSLERRSVRFSKRFDDTQKDQISCFFKRQLETHRLNFLGLLNVRNTMQQRKIRFTFIFCAGAQFCKPGPGELDLGIENIFLIKRP